VGFDGVFVFMALSPRVKERVEFTARRFGPAGR
jgi:hypothetical protein